MPLQDCVHISTDLMADTLLTQSNVQEILAKANIDQEDRLRRRAAVADLARPMAVMALYMAVQTGKPIVYESALNELDTEDACKLVAMIAQKYDVQLLAIRAAGGVEEEVARLAGKFGIKSDDPAYAVLRQDVEGKASAMTQNIRPLQEGTLLGSDTPLRPMPVTYILSKKGNLSERNMTKDKRTADFHIIACGCGEGTTRFVKTGDLLMRDAQAVFGNVVTNATLYPELGEEYDDPCAVHFPVATTAAPFARASRDSNPPGDAWGYEDTMPIDRTPKGGGRGPQGQ